MKRLCIFIALTLLLTGCSSLSETKPFQLVKSLMSGNLTTVYPNHELENEINKILANESEEEFNLNKIAKFNWDKAYIFTPYTTIDEVQKTLGFKYNGSLRIDYADHANLLIFTKNKKVVQIAEISREYADISSENNEFVEVKNPVVKIKRPHK
jgi:PBP1b-binding outer membrane lipoprotein LpoB